MRDALDLMLPRMAYPACGTYFCEIPVIWEGGIPFRYDYSTPHSMRYGMLFSAIRADAATVTIRTREDCGFRVGGGVETQDGKRYRILQTERDLSSCPKQALRMFGMPFSAEWVLHLVEIEDGWGTET